MISDIVRIVIHKQFPPPDKYKNVLPNDPIQFEDLHNYNYNLKRDTKWYYPVGVPVDYDNYPKLESVEEKENIIVEENITIDKKEIKKVDVKEENNEIKDEKEKIEINDDNDDENEKDIIERINNKIDNLEPIINKEEIYNIVMNPDLLESIIKKYNKNNGIQLFFILLNISLEYPEFRYSIMSEMKIKYNSLKFNIIDSVRKGKELYLWNKDIRDKGIQSLSNNFNFISTLEILNLEGNNITENGIALFSNNISKLNCLRKLDLQSIYNIIFYR